MTERCECCGRFGATRGRYAHPISPESSVITLYLCPLCDTEQRLLDAERIKRAARRRRKQ